MATLMLMSCERNEAPASVMNSSPKRWTMS